MCSCHVFKIKVPCIFFSSYYSMPQLHLFTGGLQPQHVITMNMSVRLKTCEIELPFLQQQQQQTQPPHHHHVHLQPPQIPAQQQQSHQQQQQPPQQQPQQQQQPSSANVSMTHFNQPALPIAAGTTVTAIHAKFRTSGDEPQGDKYNGHLVTIETAGTSGAQQEPQYAAIAYPQNTITASSSTTAAMAGIAVTNATQQHQLHVQQQVSGPQELTQDLCNAILQQQGVDTKLGELKLGQN
uniref:Uncharacterized protein n=1 Tax=Bactrocera latifrons TaxID=174628 RepID=A0A0K8VRP5_BACLA